MSKLEDALASFSRIEAPEIWPDVLEREPRPAPTGPSGVRRVGVVLLALAIAVAGLALVKATFGSNATRVPISPVRIEPRENGDLAYLSGNGAGSVFGRSRVIVAHPDGSAPMDVSPESNLTDVAWSPDGTRIAYVDSAGEFGGGAIYVMNPDGSDRHVVVDGERDQQHLSDVTWSPDGGWLAYDSNIGRNENGYIRYGVLAVPSSGGPSVQLSSGQGDEFAPTWSPDGTRIAFMRTAEDLSDSSLGVMDADGSDVRELADLGHIAMSQPAWSPDGGTIAYLDGPRLMLIGADGSDPHEIYRCAPACPLGGVSWSPDGSTLSVTHGTGRGGSVILLRPDGSDERELAHDACCLSWQPVPLAPSPTIASPTQPPGWLVDDAVRMASANGDPQPSSAEWVLTDANTAAPAVGLSSGDPNKQVYLVVLSGHFTGYTAKVPAGSSLPQGTVLAFTADRASHLISDWGISDRLTDVPGLQPFELPGPSPTPTALPESSGPVSPVLALPGAASQIAAAPNGVLYVSVLTGGGPRQILRWDAASGSVVESPAIPGAQPGVQIVFAGGSPWTAWGGELYRLDPSSLRIAQKVDLRPSVLAASPDGSLWVGAEGVLLVLDPTSGDTTVKFPVQGTPQLISFDPRGAHVYVVTDAPAGRDGVLLEELDATSGREIASAAVGVRELGGISSIAATDRGVWLSWATGMMGAVTFLPEGTLRGGGPLYPGELVPGTNAVAVSEAAGMVWVSDQGEGTLACVDPTAGDVLDRFTMAGSDTSELDGRLVTESGSALYMDGSSYLLRLDPPMACGVHG